MDIKDYKFGSRWSIQAFRAKADNIENYRSKILFLRSSIKFIESNKPTGRESISTNASIVIKKLQRYIEKLSLENNHKEDGQRDDRLKWTGDPDLLISLFYQLKNNVLGEDNRPLLDESNRRIADFIKNNFTIELSPETIFDKLNPSKIHLKSGGDNPNKIEFSITREKK